MLSLRNRLALFFFAITFLAIGALYLYVAPGLQSRLVSEKLHELATGVQRNSGQILKTIGSPDPLSVVRARVEAAALVSGDRVTLLLVTDAPGGPQLSLQADSTRNVASAAVLSFPVARRAVLTDQPTTGTESSMAGAVAEAAYPVSYQGR
jgi:hypothetical protein